MKKLIIALVAVVILGVGFLFLRDQASKDVGAPWIDVEAGTVALFDSQTGEYLGDAVSGSDVIAPVLLVASDDAAAVLYFSDGSEARLDVGAEVLVEEASYDESTDTLVAKMYISAGGIWSKIIELATPESSWEVETATAVATVRGTAFGIHVDGDASTVYGSQHDVSWIPVDKETRERLDEIGLLVTTDEVVTVTPESIKEARERNAELIVKKYGVDLVRSAWATNNEVRDEQIEQIRREVKDSVGEVKEILRDRIEERRQEVKQQIKLRQEERTEVIPPAMQQRVMERIEERKDQLERTPEVRKEVIRDVVKERIDTRVEAVQTIQQKNIDTQVEQKKVVTPVVEAKVIQEAVKEPVVESRVSSGSSGGGTSSVAPAQVVKAVSLSVSRLNPDAKPIEGVALPFVAVATFADGTTRDVTKLAEWKALGPIGSFTAPGIFMPYVLEVERERGVVKGSVVASWVQSETNEVVFAHTPVFDVHVKLEGAVDERG